MKHYVISPAAGKRLIGRALAKHPDIQRAQAGGTLVIVAGTTNGYVAEEVLAGLGQAEGFDRAGFRRGLVVPASTQAPAAELGGDVVISEGQWRKGKTIFDVVGDLHAGDVVLKGANALDLTNRRAGVLIGHPEAGTIGAILQAVYGRRVQLIVPVGLEKRIDGDLDRIAARLADAGAEGPRMLPMPGQVFTELDAIVSLCSVGVELIAGGGIYGAEGAAWIVAEGGDREMARLDELMQSVAAEPACKA